MKKTLHTKTIYRSNLISDIRIAKEAGYEAVEMVGTKIMNFLEAGYTSDDAKQLLDHYEMKMVSIVDIAHVERTEKEEVERLRKEAKIFSKFAEDVGCQHIQLVPLCAHEGKSWQEVKRLTASSVNQILDIGKPHGIQFQLEPVAWSPIHSLSQSLDFIDYTGRDNLGMVIDFWHLWYGNETKPEEVAELDKNMICNIHFCDGNRNSKGTICDEEILRGVYAGEGAICMQEWIDAVKATGYDGYWSYELVSRKHWEADTKEVAETTSKIMDKYLK
ncbi:MAG: sugar phosphate isomerase/epimerase [Clostridia bacterium]|nr:sugar phosphate isomerase/epimerase [Clostridia bacterium]